MLDEAGRLADRGKLEEAYQICMKCLNRDAFHVHAHFLMGLISHAMNNEERAETYFNKTLYLDPNHHEAICYGELKEKEKDTPMQLKLELIYCAV